MTWKTFRIFAAILNSVVFFPLWYIWITNGVISEEAALYSRLLMTLMGALLLTAALLAIAHLVLYSYAKWRGDLPKSDGLAGFMGIIIVLLLALGIPGLIFNALGWELATPVNELSSASIVLLILLLISGQWVIVLKDVLSFKSIKRSD